MRTRNVTARITSGMPGVAKPVPDPLDYGMNAKAWSAANLVMLLLFAFAAVVQFNDPDPLAWVAIYVAAATVCGLETRRRSPMWLAAAIALIAFAWSGFLATRALDVPVGSLFAEWEMRNVRIEEAREMYGLAIVGVWMLVTVGVTWRRRSPTT